MTDAAEPFVMPMMERDERGNYLRISFTWSPTPQHRAQSLRNHSQTLERLRERGGVDWLELYWIINGFKWGSHAATRQNAQATKSWLLKHYPQ